MRENTRSTWLNLFINGLGESLATQEQASMKSHTRKDVLKRTHSRPQRKDFAYYMQILDAETREIVGHLADISSGGFKLDTRKPILVNRDDRFLMNLPGEISNKPSMEFGARSRWCQVDPLDPCAYNAGYQLISISPENLEIIQRMMEKYGRDYEKKNIDLRRSYKW